MLAREHIACHVLKLKKRNPPAAQFGGLRVVLFTPDSGSIFIPSPGMSRTSRFGSMPKDFISSTLSTWKYSVRTAHVDANLVAPT